jgi:hypothetical protein
MKRLIPVAIVLLLMGGFAYAVPVTVSWVEGGVDLRVGQAWKPLDVGMKFDSASSIRLGNGAFAEFTAGTRRISLSSEGTYTIDSLMVAASAQDQKRSAVVGKLGKLVGSTEAPRSTVVGGVRGDFEGKPETTAWVEDENSPESLADEGRALVAKGNYVQAAARFAEAAEAASGPTRETYRYSQAWALAAAGNAIASIKILRGMSESGPWSAQRAILLARLDLDSGAAREAAVVLERIDPAVSMTADEASLIKELKDEAKLALASR